MKAIFVDGASLSWMREPLGIGKYDLSGIYKVLTDGIGTTRIYGKPLYTVTTEGQASIGKVLKTIGFEAVLCEYKGHDDQVIINRIKALDPATVDQFVLVSADQDFVECLREKALQGVKVHWVATSLTADGKSSMMSQALCDFIRVTNNVEFVELAGFKDQLMREPWASRPTKIVEQVRPAKSVKITLNTTTDGDEIVDILREVIKVIAKFPTIKYTIEG